MPHPIVPSRGGTVLVVESDPALGRLLVELLRPRTCVLVAGAEAALAALDSVVPSAIAVDFRLPHGEAIRLHRTLRDRAAAIPQIVIAQGSLDARALAGMAVLDPPFEPAALLTALESIQRADTSPPPRRRSRDQVPIWLPEPLTEPQQRVLRTLVAAPLNAVSIREALRSEIAPRQVNVLLRELTQLGLVERQRRTQWQLTPLGREALTRRR